MQKQKLLIYTPNGNYITTINIGSFGIPKNYKERILNDIKSKEFLEIENNGEKMFIETKNILDVEIKEEEKDNQIGF